MEHATQVALTRRVLDFVDRNTTELAEAVYLNPTATYTCPEQAERERELLFRGHPLFFGLSCELGKPGDWRADDLSGVPVLVVRAGDGRLRAFLNVCRHRGAKVATGSGSGKRMFVCPYHAFTYDLDIAAGKVLEQRKHQLLFAQRRGVFDLVLLGESQELGRRFGFEVLQLDHPRRRSVLGAFFGNVLNCHVFISIGRMARAGSGKDEELGRISRSALAVSAIWP